MTQMAFGQLCFDANITRGCVELEIRIQECVGPLTPKNSLRYNYDYQGGAITGTLDTFHRYVDPGLYTVMQIGNVNGQGAILPKNDYIEVLPIPEPEFRIFKCDGNVIVFEITDSQYEEYIFNYGDGTPSETLVLSQGNRISHQYATGGRKTFNILGNYNPGSCGGFITDTITPLEVIPNPSLSNFVYSNNTVTFQYETVNLVSYAIYHSTDGGQNFNRLDSIFPGAGVRNARITDLPSPINNNCFKVEALDACGDTFPSQTLCAFELSGVAENNRNNLEWTNYQGTEFVKFDIQRGQVLVDSTSLNTDPNNWLDSAVNCNERYCYTIRALHSNGDTSRSNTVCITSFSTDIPPGVDDLYTTVRNDSLIVTWNEGQNAQAYTVFKSRSNGLSRIETVNEPFYGEDIPGPEALTCYTIDYRDSCGNDAPKVELHCPVALELDLIDFQDYRLDWTSYEGWPEGVAFYTVQKIDPSGNVFFEEVIAQNRFTYREQGLDTISQDYFFRIEAVRNSPDSLISWSNTQLVEQSFRLFFPTAFSPNNDGLNDTFFPKGTFIDRYDLIIMNAWGEVIYSSNEPEPGWDGTFKGKDVPSGAYIYKVEAFDEKGRKFEEQGTVTLVR